MYNLRNNFSQVLLLLNFPILLSLGDWILPGKECATVRVHVTGNRLWLLLEEIVRGYN